MVSSPFSLTSCRTYTSVLLLTANALRAVRVMRSAAWAAGTQHNHNMRLREAKTKHTFSRLMALSLQLGVMCFFHCCWHSNSIGRNTSPPWLPSLTCLLTISSTQASGADSGSSKGLHIRVSSISFRRNHWFVRWQTWCTSFTTLSHNL